METASRPRGFIVLSRLSWLVLGPVLLALVILAIVDHGKWFSIWDAVFGVLVALMVGGRWSEQRSGSAKTATGEPATREHFKRYVRVLLPLAAGAWVAANVVGNHILA